MIFSIGGAGKSEYPRAKESLESACIYEMSCGDWNWDCIKSTNQFEENWYLNNIESSNP